MRNVLDKTPKAQREAMHRDLKTIFYAGNEDEARQMVVKFTEKWAHTLPSVTKCLLGAIDASLTFYRFPEAHWKRIRTSNVLERCFGRGETPHPRGGTLPHGQRGTGARVALGRAL